MPLFCDLNFWTFQSNKADMMGVLAEQLKLDGILNTKKIFSTEKNVAQSQFVPLSNKTNSHCNQVIADFLKWSRIPSSASGHVPVEFLAEITCLHDLSFSKYLSFTLDGFRKQSIILGLICVWLKILSFKKLTLFKIRLNRKIGRSTQR